MEMGESFNLALRDWVTVFMRRSFRDFKQFMDETGLSPSQVGTMMRLHHCRSIGISDIGEEMRISAPAASQMVDRLVQQGLLERAEDPKDRRFKQVTLTGDGKQLVENGIRARLSWMEALTSAFTPEEQERIIEVLVLLAQAARRLESDES